MPFEHWLAFVAASAVILVIPGPTILTVISYSVAHGRKATLPLVAAVALGDATALVVSLLGIGALLATSAFWFTAIKVVGGLYLLYLGQKMLRAGFAAATPAVVSIGAPDERIFATTYVVTALNPKGMIFFTAFLPQFVAREESAARQLWILALTFVVMAAINAAGYVAFAAAARGLLISGRAQRGTNLAGGLLLAAAGCWALLATRA